MRAISMGRATVDSLVSYPRWQTTGFSGCCGARILSRLGAGYYDPKSVDLTTCTLGRNATTINRFARTVKNNNASRGGTGGIEVTSLPLPLEVCFAAVLQQMRLDMGRPSQVWVATDNVVGRGDVHNGPFSMRNFMQWLKDNELAEVTESSRVGSNVAYTIVLNRRAIYSKVQWGVRTYNALRQTCRADIDEAITPDWYDEYDDYGDDEEMW